MCNKIMHVNQNFPLNVRNAFIPAPPSFSAIYFVRWVACIVILEMIINVVLKLLLHAVW